MGRKMGRMWQCHQCQEQTACHRSGQHHISLRQHVQASPHSLCTPLQLRAKGCSRLPLKLDPCPPFRVLCGGIPQSFQTHCFPSTHPLTGLTARDPMNRACAAWLTPPLPPHLEGLEPSSSPRTAPPRAISPRTHPA